MFSQYYYSQTYKEFLEGKKYERNVLGKINECQKTGEYHQLLDYLNEVDTARFNFSVHPYKASTYAALGDTLKAKEEVFLHMRYRSPIISIPHYSKWYNISERMLEAYRDSLQPAYLARNYPLMDTAISNRLKHLQFKDQQHRGKGEFDTLQLKLDRENTAEILSMVKEKGHWLTRYCTPDVNQLNALVMHFTDEVQYYLLPYMIEESRLGYAHWIEPVSVIWRLMLSNGQKYGYRKVYATMLNEKGEVDMEQSLLGLHVASAFMRSGNPISLQATTNYTSDNYIAELEKVRQYYISLGIDANLISINPEKIAAVEFPNEPTCYIVFSGVCTDRAPSTHLF